MTRFKVGLPSWVLSFTPYLRAWTHSFKILVQALHQYLQRDTFMGSCNLWTRYHASHVQNYYMFLRNHQSILQYATTIPAAIFVAVTTVVKTDAIQNAKGIPVFNISSVWAALGSFCKSRYLSIDFCDNVTNIAITPTYCTSQLERLSARITPDKVWWLARTDFVSSFYESDQQKSWKWRCNLEMKRVPGKLYMANMLSLSGILNIKVVVSK